MVPKIAVILTDSARQIIWVNEDFTKITGYGLSEVIGKKPGSILQGPKSEEEAILRIRQNLDKQIPLQENITNYRKNGEAYLCKLVIHPVFNLDHQLTNFIAFEVDGSEVSEDHKLPLLNIDQKYRSSSLKGIDEIRLYNTLKSLIETEQLYLKPELSLKMVAELLNTNTKYLSQVVNQHSGYNFQQFINHYRIEEVKRKITNDQFSHLTLFGIAIQCGFKNKSTFYKVFKDITGLTPRAYLKRMN